MTRCVRTLVILLSALFAAAPAEARRLNFDTVCPAGQCLLALQYLDLGLTFEPPSTYSIVDGGTGGLTGTNGTKFVLVGSPNMFHMRNTRLAKSATFDVAGVAGAAADLDLTVYPTLAGAPAGPPQLVSLGGGGVWRSVVVSESGGFDGVRIQATGTGNLAFGVDNVYWGGTCAQFADISPTSTELCEAVEILYGRGITLGATNTTYNPGDPTTRGQMALFLARDAKAQQPQRFYFSSTHSNVNLDSAPLICATTTPLVFDTTVQIDLDGEVVLRNSTAPGTRVSVTAQFLPYGSTIWGPVPPGWAGEKTLTAALGGLQRESVRTNASVPVLGGTPFLARLFATGSGTTGADCRLTVFIRPAILPAP